MSVLSFRHYNASAVFPSFLAISGPFKEDEDRGQLFSVRVMKVGKTVLLIDLGPVMSYWQWLAGREESPFISFLETYLQSTFAKEFSFCLAYNPFQCLLLLSLMDQKGECGKLLSLSTKFGRKTFHSLNFTHWQKPLKSFQEILAKNERQNFSAMRQRFDRFLRRMNIKSPFEVEMLEPDSLTRRFDKYFGAFWTWFFEGLKDVESPAQGDLFLGNQELKKDLFPWQRQKSIEEISVKRFLEQAILEWEHLKALLVTDLVSMLKEHPQVHDLRVTRFDWKVTLENDKTYLCPIMFRNPHSLTQDAPDFESFLFQAYYAYMDMMAKVKTREEDLDYPMNMAIVDWSLELVETLFIHPVEVKLFQDGRKAVQEFERFELENKLPYQLEHFVLEESFYPESSFSHDISTEKSDISKLWFLAAKNRPLFIFKGVSEFEVKEHYRKIYLERVSYQWWKGDAPFMGERDYYMVEDEGKTLWWAFHDPEKGWFKHGLFS